MDEGDCTDSLYGGSGADIFHYDRTDVHDIIKDFQDDVDTIQLDDFTFAQGTNAFSFASQIGSDVVFDFGAGDWLGDDWK